MNKLRVTFYSLVALLFGCSTNTPDASSVIPIKVLWQSNQCSVSKPTIQRISDLEELNSLTRNPVVFNPNQTNINADFSNTIIFVSPGRKPNSGYGINVDSDNAVLQNKTLTLPLSFTTPSPEKFYAQILVSTCLIVSTPALSADIKIRLENHQTLAP